MLHAPLAMRAQTAQAAAESAYFYESGQYPAQSGQYPAGQYPAQSGQYPVAEPYGAYGGEVEPLPVNRWHAHRPLDTLGAATFLTAASIHLAREGDDASSICVAVGTSPLRAAAWLRARGAAVGHAAARSRLSSPEGHAYAAAARTVISRSSSKTAVTLAEVRSQKIAAWLALDRVAIVLVGASWPTCCGNDVHALVVVAAGQGSLSVFDPAGCGLVEELSFQDLDALRSEPTAAWEVLVATRR